MIRIIALVAIVITTPALASHPPGERTWQAIVNGTDCTVDQHCKVYGQGGACVKR